MELFYPNIHWNETRKIAFRFFFLFVILFLAPLPPALLVPFFGNTVLGIGHPIDLEQNGSGDKTMHYVMLFMSFLLAFIGAAIWSFLDRKRKTYDTLFHYFLILCRYYLSYTLFGYGILKVYHIQMPEIRINHLLMPIGDQTPMGLAWRFIGFSSAYSAFSGWMEIIPAILLLFRRTCLAGALMAFTVLLNVAVMNFTFDIPVKIYSSFLVLLSLIILSPDFGRITRLFFTFKDPGEKSFKPLFIKKPWKITRTVFKSLFILVVLFTAVQYMAYDPDASANRSPLFGVYRSTQIIKNNDTIPLYTDSSAWRHLVFATPGFLAVYKFNDKKQVFSCELDTAKKTMRLSYLNDSTRFYSFNYVRENDSIINFDGIIDMDKFALKVKKIERKQFNLYKRGFNWINESPYNR